MKCKMCEEETRLMVFEHEDHKIKVCDECNRWLVSKFRSKKHWKMDK